MEAPPAAPPVVKIGPWEGLATRLIATGAHLCTLVSLLTGKITGVAFFSTQPGERRLRNVILAMNGIPLNAKDEATKTEILAIVSRIAAGNLHTELVSFLGQRYLVTTMRPGVYLARSINPASQCGLVFALMDGAIAVATYGAPTLPMDAMASVESTLYQTQAKRSRGEQ